MSIDTMRLVRALLRARDGSMIVSLSATMAVLVAVMMLAVDMGRLQLAETRLQIALDAAALAATRAIQSPTLDQDIEQVVEANLEGLGIGFQLDGVQRIPLTDAHGIRRLRLEATGKLSSPLGPLLDQAELDWLEVRAENETLRATRGVELVMVLDNTGSMRSSDRIGALRTAAVDLADVLFEGSESAPNLWVGIVPYSATVNIGSGYTNWLDPGLPAGTLASYTPTTWKGCVLARTGGEDQTEAPPSEAPLTPFFWPTMPGTHEDYPDYDAGTPNNAWPDGAGSVDERNEAQNQGYGPNLGCGPSILPLSPLYSEVTAKIAEMQPWHRGGTMANVGLVWGWRVLSPEWRGLWRDADGAAITTLPIDYDTPYLSKVMVLMTDGDNQWFKKDFTAYRYPSDGLLGSDSVDDRMLKACTALKEQGIVLFTVTFGGSVNEDTSTLYESCASSPQQNVYFPGRKYYHAPNADDLRAAFADIGGQLTELRLTQ